MARKKRGQYYKRILRDPGDYRFIVAIDIEGAKDLPDAYRRLRVVLPKECAYESTDEAYGPSGKTIPVPYLSEVRSRVLAEEGDPKPLPSTKCLLRPEDREVYTPNEDGTYSNHWLRTSFQGHAQHAWDKGILLKLGFIEGNEEDIANCEERAKGIHTKLITNKGVA